MTSYRQKMWILPIAIYGSSPPNLTKLPFEFSDSQVGEWLGYHTNQWNYFPSSDYHSVITIQTNITDGTGGQTDRYELTIPTCT